MMFPDWLWLWLLALVLVGAGLLYSCSGRYQQDMRRLPLWACVGLVLFGAALVVGWALISGQLAQLMEVL